MRTDRGNLDMTIDDITGLTSEERTFLKGMGIPATVLFNADGKGKGHFRPSMKRRDLLFAFNTTPCAAGGHRLRDRTGHCIVCKPANIAYTRRHVEPGHVYVAASASTQSLKVGTTTDLTQRMGQLNYYGYGGTTDWVAAYSHHCARAGAVEFAAHRRLYGKGAVGSYVKNGEVVECYELFRCTLDEAIAAVESAIRDPRRDSTWL
jgi:hypothetical protein